MTITTDPTSGAVASQTLADIAMGYFRSRALCAAARLGVADALGDQERSADELAASCAADPVSLHRLLRALATFGVVSETRPGSFALTAFGQPLRKDAPDSEWAPVVLWADLIADSWSYLTDCVRSGRSARDVRPDGVPSRWSQDPEASAIFTDVMGTGDGEDYLPFARAWDFSTCATVADLGGGGGALISAILRTYPAVRGMLVDRQEAIEYATDSMADSGLTGRCTLIAADLLSDVPAGADVYILQHVLHAYDDATAVEMLRRCRSVLRPEGRVLVIEIVLPDVIDRVDPNLEIQLMSDLNMLAVTGGRERSAIEWRALIEAAGLECRQINEVPGESASMIEAASIGER